MPRTAFGRWWTGSGRAASASSAPLSMSGWSHDPRRNHAVVLRDLLRKP